MRRWRVDTYGMAQSRSQLVVISLELTDYPLKATCRTGKIMGSVDWSSSGLGQSTQTKLSVGSSSWCYAAQSYHNHCKRFAALMPLFQSVVVNVKVDYRSNRKAFFIILMIYLCSDWSKKNQIRTQVKTLHFGPCNRLTANPFITFLLHTMQGFAAQRRKVCYQSSMSWSFMMTYLNKR